MNLRLIVNPIAGLGSAKVLLPYILYRLWCTGVTCSVRYPASIAEISECLADLNGDDPIGFVGGDGTLHEIVNALPNFNHPICAFPTGTGNAYAKELKLSRSTCGIAEALVGRKYTEWQVAYDQRSSTRFVLFCGAGFHSQIIRQYHMHRQGPTPITSYLKWGYHSYKYESLPRVRVIIDGNPVCDDASWVDICNISHYGGPLRPLLKASPHDDIFEVITFKGRTKRDVLRFLTYAFMNNLGISYKSGAIECFRGRSIALESALPEKLPFHMDGDFKGYLPVQISALNGARLKLVATS